MKHFYTLGIALLLAFTASFAQNEVVVNVGDDIITKIAEVEEGGTLLIMPGVHEANYATIVVNTSMTIKNDGGINNTRVHIEQIDVPAENISLTIDGIIFSGAEVDSLTGIETVDPEEVQGSYFLNLVSGEAMTYGDIVVKNCVLNHYNRSIIRGDRDSYYAKSITFDNCIIDDLRGGGDYGPFRMKSKITFDKFSISNCTFSNIPNKLIDLQDMDDYPCEVNINHCTFYNWGGGKSGQYLFDIRNNSEATLILKNSILGRTMVEEEVVVNGWRIADPDGVPIKNCEMSFCVYTPNFVLEEGTIEGTAFNKAEYNYEYDPEFSDPDNGDFMVPAGSDLHQMSDEGTLVGDPRWVNAKVSSPYIKDGSLKVYPTIASEVIFVNNKNTSSTEVDIYTSLGKHVMNVTAVENDQPLDISALEKGVYLINLKGDTEQTFRFIKK